MHPSGPHSQALCPRPMVGAGGCRAERRGGERPSGSLERRSPSRSRRGGVLVVCGRRSGVYFTGLLRHLRLEEGVTLSLCVSDDPAVIVDQAVRVCRTQGPFWRVYVVVCQEDGGGSLSVPDWRSVGYPVQFQFIVSAPSFHVWLLLHCVEVPRMQWRDAGHLSLWLGEQMERHFAVSVLADELLLFAVVGQGVAQAVIRGQRLARLRGLVPVTGVHELVSHLLKLRDTARRLSSDA